MGHELGYWLGLRELYGARGRLGLTCMHCLGLGRSTLSKRDCDIWCCMLPLGDLDPAKYASCSLFLASFMNCTIALDQRRGLPPPLLLRCSSLSPMWPCCSFSVTWPCIKRVPLSICRQGKVKLLGCSMACMPSANVVVLVLHSLSCSITCIWLGTDDLLCSDFWGENVWERCSTRAGQKKNIEMLRNGN